MIFRVIWLINFIQICLLYKKIKIKIKFFLISPLFELLLRYAFIILRKCSIGSSTRGWY